MRIARVIGIVTGTVKDTQLSGQKMLIVDVLDAENNVIDPSLVALDVCSAGPGERSPDRINHRNGYRDWPNVGLGPGAAAAPTHTALPTQWMAHNGALTTKYS